MMRVYTPMIHCRLTVVAAADRNAESGSLFSRRLPLGEREALSLFPASCALLSVVSAFAVYHKPCAYSGRELVDGSVVIIAPVNGGSVEITKPINDHSVIGKRAIRRALEGMNYSLDPLTAANRT